MGVSTHDLDSGGESAPCTWRTLAEAIDSFASANVEAIYLEGGAVAELNLNIKIIKIFELFSNVIPPAPLITQFFFFF